MSAGEFAGKGLVAVLTAVLFVFVLVGLLVWRAVLPATALGVVGVLWGLVTAAGVVVIAVLAALWAAKQALEWAGNRLPDPSVAGQGGWA